jgi:hypothetical protein
MAQLRMTRSLGAVLGALIIIGVACGSSDVDTTTATSALDRTSTTAPVDQIDWVGGTSTLSLPNGWALGPCESGPRQLCARDGDRTVATIELSDFPASTFPHVQAVLDAGGSARKALEAHEAEYLETFIRDRRQGCGADYEVKALQVETATLGDRPAIAYGFEGVVRGRTVERNRHWLTLEGGTLFLVAANGIEPGTCMHSEELVAMTVAQLRGLEPTLKQVFAVSPLPSPSLCVAPGSSTLVPCEGSPR